jgi:hypothetical protein
MMKKLFLYLFSVLLVGAAPAYAEHETIVSILTDYHCNYRYDEYSRNLCINYIKEAINTIKIDSAQQKCENICRSDPIANAKYSCGGLCGRFDYFLTR